MKLFKRTRTALLGLAAGLAVTGAAQSQFSGGVSSPTPGSAPTVSGPNSTNPSAAASDTRNPSAFNPSAAVSATSSPNALNPSSTPSTFAPGVSSPNNLSPRLASPSRVVRPKSRAAERQRRRGVRGRRALRPVPAPVLEAGRRGETRARGVMGSVCRGC